MRTMKHDHKIMTILKNITYLLANTDKNKDKNNKRNESAKTKYVDLVF